MSDSLDDILAEASSLSLIAPDAGELRDAASPFAFAPARVLGGRETAEPSDLGTTSSKCYSVVTIRGSDPSLCFGVVGVGGVSFCIRKNCRIKVHEDTKIWLSGLDESVIFISRVPDAVVYTDPFVKIEAVTVETQEDWKNKTMTLPNWVRAFRAVTISENDKVSVNDVKVKTKFLNDAEKFRTPAKKRNKREEDDEVKTQKKNLYKTTMVLLDSGLPSVDDTDALDAVIIDGSMLKGGLTRIVARIEANVVTLGKAVQEAANLSNERFDDTEKDVSLMSGVIQNLHATIGYTVGLDPRFEAPTLWGTTSFVAEEVARIGQLVTGLEANIGPLEVTVQGVKDRQDHLASVVRSTGPDDLEKMRKVLVLVMGHVKKVSPELDQIRSMIQHLEGELLEVRKSKRQRYADEDYSPREGDTMDELMNMMTSNASVGGSSPAKSESSMGTQGGEMRTPRRSSDGPSSVVVRDDILRDKAILRRMENEISMLVADIGLLKACSEDKSVKFGGLGLRTLHECREWVGVNFKSLRYGLVMDPLLLLDRIFGADDAEAESQFKILESRVKLRITTGAEAAAIKALHFSRPRLFHKGRVAMVSERNTSKLSKLPTYKSWKSAGEGVSNYIIRQMNLIHSTVANDIGYAFGVNSQEDTRAQVLATASLNATITFVTQLIGFIDTIYEKLLVQSRFTTEQAWALTTQILDRVCEDLYAPKEGVAAAMTVEDPASICSHVLWSCLKIHDVMTSYIDHHFVNHPAISAEYVKFLATNSGSEKVDKMDSTIASLTEKVAKGIEETKKAINKADVASSKCADLVKEIQSLAKKVKQLEDKAGR